MNTQSRKFPSVHTSVIYSTCTLCIPVTVLTSLNTLQYPFRELISPVFTLPLGNSFMSCVLLETGKAASNRGRVGMLILPESVSTAFKEEICSCSAFIFTFSNGWQLKELLNLPFSQKDCLKILQSHYTLASKIESNYKPKLFEAHLCFSGYQYQEKISL